MTLAELTGLPQDDLGAMVGRQTPVLALFVPLILVGMVDGWRGVKAVWPAAIVGGFTFAIGQFVSSNYISVELTDIIGALLSVGAMVLFLRVWQPGSRCWSRARAIAARRRRRPRRGLGDIFRAYAPYLIIIVVFGLAPWGPLKDFLAKGPSSRGDITTADGEAPSATTFKFGWLGAAGTLLLLSGLITMAR